MTQKHVSPAGVMIAIVHLSTSAVSTHGMMEEEYRVTHLVDSNFLLTLKHKFRFGLARSGQARTKRNFCFDVKGRFQTT